jgi:hypothetical protein
MIVRNKKKPVTEEGFNAWCHRFRDLLVREWPGLVGVIIDGGVHDLVRVVFLPARSEIMIRIQS